MGMTPFRQNYATVTDILKKDRGLCGPTCTTNPQASSLEAEKNPEEADNKGFPEGPLLLGAQTDCGSSQAGPLSPLTDRRGQSRPGGPEGGASRGMMDGRL